MNELDKEIIAAMRLDGSKYIPNTEKLSVWFKVCSKCVYQLYRFPF